VYRRSLLTRGSLRAGKILLWSLLALSLLSLGRVAAAKADESVDACGMQDAGGVNNVFVGYETFGIVAANYCGQAEQSLQLANDSKNTIPPGQSSGWVATAPAGLEIAGATVPSMQLFDTVGTGYVADFYWANGGSQRVDDAWSSYSVGGIFPSSIFGFDLECSSSGTTCPADAAAFLVDDVQLDVREIVNPSITALGGNNLWYKGASEYVRGSGWSIAYSASAPSGIASMSASQNGQPVQLPIAPGCPVPNHTVWQQCPGTQTWSPTISLSGNGAQQLVLSATSAAGNTSPYTESIDVDNQAPTVSLAGPSTALSTAGTQYITATATTGPSGLGAIDCSVDGGPTQSYKSSPASIPVSGLGNHAISCTATNQSYNSAGQVAVSTPATSSLDIQEPSVSVATFSTIKGLKCGKVKDREKVKVLKHGKVHVKTVVKKVTKCHPRVVVKKICHDHHCKKQRVVEIPHTVQQSETRAGYGKSATVSGWLGTSSGVALGGQQMSIMTAPNNGSNAFTQAATVTTAADGTWTATLPPGPSRLVEAVFGGTSAVAPASSAELQLVVPASIKLVSISPRKIAWGGTVHISGDILGGYLPTTGELVRLRIGYGKASTTYGVQTHVTGAGSFSTTYTFGAGDPSVRRRYWFELSTLPVGDFAYAPGSSRRLSVLVGGHPKKKKTTPKKHHKAKHKKKKHAKHHKAKKHHKTKKNHKKARRR